MQLPINIVDCLYTTGAPNKFSKIPGSHRSYEYGELSHHAMQVQNLDLNSAQTLLHGLGNAMERVLNTLEEGSPVGLFLSGGLDSALLLELLMHNEVVQSRNLTVRLYHYAVRGNEEDTSYAKLLADRHDLPLTTVRKSDEELIALVMDGEFICKPHTDTALFYHAALLEAAAADGVTVVFDGTGADGCFATSRTGEAQSIEEAVDRVMLSWDTGSVPGKLLFEHLVRPIFNACWNEAYRLTPTVLMHLLDVELVCGQVFLRKNDGSSRLGITVHSPYMAPEVLAVGIKEVAAGRRSKECMKEAICLVYAKDTRMLLWQVAHRRKMAFTNQETLQILQKALVKDSYWRDARTMNHNRKIIDVRMKRAHARAEMFGKKAPAAQLLMAEFTLAVIEDKK